MIFIKLYSDKRKPLIKEYNCYSETHKNLASKLFHGATHLKKGETWQQVF